MISILEYKCLQWKLIQIQKTYCASNAVQTINNMTYLGTWACHLDIKNTLSRTVMVLDAQQIRIVWVGFFRMNKLEVGASDISNSQRFQNWFHTKLKGIFLGKIKENVQSILIKLWKTFSTGDLKLCLFWSKENPKVKRMT